MRILFTVIVFLSVYVFFAPIAQAQIAANSVIRTMLPHKKPIENVDVSNFSKDKILQADISVEESIRKADGTEEVIPSDDFLIAPKMMILRPGERKKARLVLRKPASEDKERYYRASFKAKIPDPIRMKELALTSAESINQDNINAGVSMISGMGIFITVAPKNMNPKLTWERDATGITFHNEGNVSVDMRARKEYCFDKKKKDCTTLPDKRIYPGHKWRFEISGNKDLIYYYKIYNKAEKAIIGAVE